MEKKEQTTFHSRKMKDQDSERLQREWDSYIKIREEISNRFKGVGIFQNQTKKTKRRCRMKKSLEVQKKLLEFSAKILSKVEEFCKGEPSVSVHDFKSFFDAIFEVYSKYVETVEAGGFPEDFLSLATHLLKELNSHPHCLTMEYRNSKTPEGGER